MFWCSLRAPRLARARSNCSTTGMAERALSATNSARYKSSAGINVLQMGTYLYAWIAKARLRGQSGAGPGFEISRSGLPYADVATMVCGLLMDMHMYLATLSVFT